jgi:hypothetical protein
MEEASIPFQSVVPSSIGLQRCVWSRSVWVDVGWDPFIFDPFSLLAWLIVLALSQR